MYSFSRNVFFVCNEPDFFFAYSNSGTLDLFEVLNFPRILSLQTERQKVTIQESACFWRAVKHPKDTRNKMKL